MSGLLRARLKKPRKWELNPAQLAQPFRGMWNNLESLFPMWESGYRFNDHAKSKTGAANPLVDVTANAAARVARIAGRGVKVVSSPQTAPGGTLQAGLGSNRSIMAVFVVDAFPSATVGWIWGPVQGGAWLHIVGVTSVGAPYFYEVTGGAVNIAGANGLIVAGRTHCLVGVADSIHGGIASLFLDGRLVTRVTGQGTFLALGTGFQTLANGQASPFSNLWDGVLHMGAYWNRVLSDGEAAALSADPYGLIRPIKRMNKVLVVPSSAPSSGARSFVPGLIG